MINQDKDNNDNYKGIGVSCFYDENNCKLLIGDHLGFINIYDLSILNVFMEKKFEDDDSVRKFAFNNINIKSEMCIHASKETIKHINIPQDLKPKIILSTSNERIIRLFDYETGKYIDSLTINFPFKYIFLRYRWLKQASIKYTPIPIAIEYIKNNPFLNDVDEIEHKSKIELYDTENILKLIEKNNNLNATINPIFCYSKLFK